MYSREDVSIYESTQVRTFGLENIAYTVKMVVSFPIANTFGEDRIASRTGKTISRVNKLSKQCFNPRIDIMNEIWATNKKR